MDRVVEAIAALPSGERAVLVMRDVQGLSGSETAQTLGLSRAAMKSRLHRGRVTVRSALERPESLSGNDK
jgi:RNA polymerase sigma factor (sigma-70 family)